MKKIILSFLIFTFASFAMALPSFAISPTTTPASQRSEPSPTIAPTTKLESQINELKERVASRVAELKLVEKRGVIIKAKESTNTQIQAEDMGGNIRFIDVDEFTKFASSSAKSFGISDIKPGTQLGILGLYNKNSKRILARFIETVTMETYILGKVSAKDEKNFTINVESSGKNTTVDIERTTKTLAYEDGETLKAGFKDIEPGQTVIVLGFDDKDEKNRMSASKAILLLNIPIDSKYVVEEAPASTRSATRTPTPTPASTRGEPTSSKPSATPTK